MRFAQRRGQMVFILGVDTAAGETHLTSVVIQMISALCEQYLIAVLANHQRHQHSCFA